MQPARLFVSYSHKDSDRVARLRSHCALLIKQGLVSWWYDRNIQGGGSLDAEIGTALEGASLFLAMVSPDFLASTYCSERELIRALERHQAGDLTILPVILEPCDWRHSPLGQLKASPDDGRPVSQWPNENEAYLDVVTTIRRLLAAPPPVAIGPTTGGVASITESKPRPKYRVRRDFDAVEREDFVHQSFVEIRDYFRQECEAIGQTSELTGRCRDLGPTGFTCTVVNRRLSRGTAHLTVHAGGGRTSLGDIHYSFDANAPVNTANGWLNVATDDYDLFLQYMDFTGSGSGRRVTSAEAAELLWSGVLDRAGITHE